MTREEAKEILTHNWTRVDNPNYSESELDEAVDMAIEALKADPKHGKWQVDEAECIYGKKYILTCSECGESVSVTEAALPYEHYCRNCGAKMDGGNECR